MKQLIIPALLALFIAGCSSTPDTGAEQSGAPVEGRDGVRTVTAGGVGSSQLPAILTDPKSILSKRSVYFDYDSFEIKPEFKDLVAAHAKFLNENRQFRVLVQGNTDERGSREYNIALGERRSVAVRRAMEALGVQPNQMRTVSYGEERPAVGGHDESAYAQNRRVEIAY